MTSATSAVLIIVSTISPMGSYDPNNDAQAKLINAAVEAGVKRFAPSEWAHGSTEGIDLYDFKVKPWELLKTSGLEYTKFVPGLFTNILVTGTPKVDEAQALAGLRAWNYIVNMKAGTVDLPGDGSKQIAWTEINDVCRFVVASLDLDKWPEESTMRGDTASFADVVKMIEKIRGGQKMLVKENSIEEMEEMAKNPQLAFYNQTRIVIARDGFENDGTLNKLCPEVEPATIEDCLQKWWGGVPVENPSWEEDKAFGG